MWLMPIAALVEALITINVMRSIGFIPPLVVFVVLLAAIAVLGFARPGPRVFLVGGIVLLLFVGLNLPFAIEGLIDPIGTSHAWTDIIAIVAGITGAIAGFAAFVELRRGAPVVRAIAYAGSARRCSPSSWSGASSGTSYVSVRGFSALEGTPGLGVANGVLRHRPSLPSSWMRRLDIHPEDAPAEHRARAPSTWSTPTRLRTRSTSSSSGRVLSYPVPGHSTTAVVLDLIPGSYTYWCAIPGHRSTMEGTLEVLGS